MQRLFIDYETFYTTEYSLSRMTTREYIMDARFEVMGASIAIDDGPTSWFEPEDLPLILSSFKWEETQLIAHNTLFDGAITQWRYGYKPKLWMDTMGMSQALLSSQLGSVALKRVAKAFGLEKDSGALLNMRGLRGMDIDKSSFVYKRYIAYANSDVDNCRIIFNKLLPAFPKKELVVIDTLLRMYFDGALMLDDTVIDGLLHRVRADAEEKLRLAGIPNKSALRSRDTFAGLLRSHGVTPPTKKSPVNGEETFAFAKNDLEFTKLLQHDDPKVVALVDAKLNASSTIEETRAQRFLNLSRLEGSTLNVPLRYAAARTFRCGGSDNLNLQNLPRKSPLREAIISPPGHKIVVVDASQIEARVLTWIASCFEITTAFRNKEDVYSTFASKVFGYEVNKDDHPSERFIGKTGILSLGYAVGWRKVQWALLTSPFYDQDVPDEFAQKLVSTYRGTYPEIPKFWEQCDHFLEVMAGGRTEQWGMLGISKSGIKLPSGLTIQYPQLHNVTVGSYEERGYKYYDAKYKSMSNVYGGAVCAHICQALARIIVTDAMLEMRAKGWDMKLFVHDELVYVVPDDQAQHCYDDLMQAFVRTPPWANENLPLAAEGGIATRYNEAK